MQGLLNRELPPNHAYTTVTLRTVLSFCFGILINGIVDFKMQFSTDSSS